MFCECNISDKSKDDIIKIINKKKSVRIYKTN